MKTVTPLRAIGAVILVAAAGACSGCLSYDTLDVRATLREGETWGEFTETLEGLGSDEETPAGHSADFRDLLRAVESDEYLVEAVGDGIYVRDRKLWIERGRLMGRRSGLFDHLAHLGFDASSSDTTGFRLPLDEGLEVVSTNGIVAGDSGRASIEWPSRTREFRWKVHNRKADEVSSLADSYKVHAGRVKAISRKKGSR